MSPRGASKPKIMMVTVGPEPGRKYAHLVVLTHRGGGWWRGQCMGEAKRCKAGKCPHVNGLGIRGKSGSVRPVKPMARDAA